MVERNFETLMPLDLSCIRHGLWLSPHSCEAEDKFCEDLCYPEELGGQGEEAAWFAAVLGCGMGSQGKGVWMDVSKQSAVGLLLQL